MIVLFVYLHMPYKRKKYSSSLHTVEYTDTYTKEMDTEGLSILKWSMLDSPDKLGSGKMFMESEPVFILDEVLRKERINAFIMLGYVSKVYGDKILTPINSSHRAGKAIEVRCINNIKRFKIIKGLIQYGIERIEVSNEFIYFDTDNYLKESTFICF